MQGQLPDSISLLYSQGSQLVCSDPEQINDEGTACALIDLNDPVKGQIQGCAWMFQITIWFWQWRSALERFVYGNF